MAIKAVRGVRDILPSETGRWQRGEAAARATFEAYGYREIRLPLFERTELFARGIGDETDIVKKEMYTFEDRGGDSLTLRPEATAGLVRAYIEHGFQVEPKPVRLYTVGPMFRYERPPRSSKVYISFCTMSEPAPDVRWKSSVSSNPGV